MSPNHETVAAMAAEYLTGARYQQLAERYGLSTSTVGKYLRREVQPHPKGRRRVNDGLTNRQRYTRSTKGHLTSVASRLGIDKRAASEALQRSACDICGMTKEENRRRLAVDHKHGTRQVRGLLCSRCNTMIGQARENPAILLKAVDYLRERS